MEDEDPLIAQTTLTPLIQPSPSRHALLVCLGQEIPICTPYETYPNGVRKTLTLRKMVRLPFTLPPVIEAVIAKQIVAPPFERYKSSFLSSSPPPSLYCKRCRLPSLPVPVPTPPPPPSPSDMLLPCKRVKSTSPHPNNTDEAIEGAPSMFELGESSSAHMISVTGKDYAKTVKNQSKPGNIRHEIESLHQKPDQRAFFNKDQANKCKFHKIESSKAILAISTKSISKEKGKSKSRVISAISAKRSNRRSIPNIVELEIRTIAEIVSTHGRYGEAIVILEILAENFEIKTNLLQLVQANKFHGFERDNPHTHISNFKRMTETLKYRDVPNDAIKFMLFPYSLEGAARVWTPSMPLWVISNLVEIVNKQVIVPAKAVEKTYVTCGGAHAYYECIATDSNQTSVCAATGSYNQVSLPNQASYQIPPPGFAPVQNNPKRFNQNQGSFFQNHPSTSGTLPSNIVPNSKGEMKVVTTRSGLAYEGPSIPTESPLEKVDEQNTEEILDKEHSNSSGSTAQVQPPIVSISIPEPDVPRTQSKPTIPMEVCHALADLGASINLMPLSIWKKLSLPELTPTRMTLELADRSITHPKGVTEDVFVKVRKFHFLTYFVVVDFKSHPRVPLILGRSFLRNGRALIDVYGEDITLRVNDESITFNLNQTMRYSSTYDDNSMNSVDVIDISCEEFVHDV
uniref:Reverse transcriptase domain-containing protein n=1 Tax=Tanacetum cinerariifolium TaxID=118510 RepID=A0A6L2MZ80_TANCI|nr:reverse transcriptase domain-containing protein [Tanacetum cinerariifolium]